MSAPPLAGTGTLLRAPSDLSSASRLAGKDKAAQAAKEFESILLAQWMQGAQDSFGSVPGSDEDRDACSDQITSFATQALAKHLSDAGGLGLGQTVSRALSSAETHSSSAKTGVLSQPEAVIDRNAAFGAFHRE